MCSSELLGWIRGRRAAFPDSRGVLCQSTEPRRILPTLIALTLSVGHMRGAPGTPFSRPPPPGVEKKGVPRKGRPRILAVFKVGPLRRKSAFFALFCPPAVNQALLRGLGGTSKHLSVRKGIPYGLTNKWGGCLW